MQNANESMVTASIVHRWDRVLDLEIAARSGDESALRFREIVGLRRWFL